jgi:glycosyltransferase involved in cell wall biosynthesis
MSATGTIIIPAHNEQYFIAGLLKSLETHLSAPTQIVVVANGCSDATAETARALGCEVVEIAEKEFPSAARNYGVSLAKGDVFAFLDADVEVTQAWCNAYKRLLDCDNLPEYLLTGDQYWISKKPSWIEKHWFLPLREFPKNYINGGNVIVTRTLFDKINGFDERLETGEDVDFCLRAQQVTDQFVINPDFVTLHEGFPKDVKSFMKRERWHGKGDFEHLDFLIRSKTAILTLVFMLLHGLLVLSLIALAINGSGMAASISAILVLTIIAILMLTSCIRFKTFAVLFRPAVLVIQYLYFVGRGFAAIDAGFKYLRTRILSNS